MPATLHKYLAAVVLRLGRRFSVSALINQILPKYLEIYLTTATESLVELKKKALEKFEGEETLIFDHRMPIHVAESIQARIPGLSHKEAFHAALENLILLAAYDFSVNGPLKGREF